MFDDEKEIVIDPLFTEKWKKFKSTGKRFLGFIIFLGLVLFFVTTCVYRLQTGTVAVITRFGKVVGINEKPGLHMKMPVIHTIYKVDLETIHKMEYGYRTTASGGVLETPEYSDQDIEEQVIIEAKNNNASIVLLNLIVRFQIADPVNYLFEVDDLESTMRLALEDTVRSTMQTFTTDQALENKEVIDEEILPKLQKKLDKYHSGIKVVQVTTQNVALLPTVEETRQAVEEANQYKKGKEEEAQKYANTVLPIAEAEATKMYEDAKGYSAQVVANAKADVAEFEALYSQYLVNPNVVKEKYYLEAMEAVFKNNQLIIDQSGDGNMLKFFNATPNDLNQSEKGAND